MLGFIPVFILSAAAITVFVLRFVPRGTGIAWLAAILSAFAAWVYTIVIKTKLPFSFEHQSYIKLGIGDYFPYLQFDIIAWPMVLTTCAAVLAILLVSSARIGMDSDNNEWAGVLALGTVGIVGCLSANILTSLMVIGLFDLLDLLVLLLRHTNEEEFKSSLVHATVRLVSLFFFFAAYAWQVSISSAGDDWKSILPEVQIIILSGCMVRLTILPLIRLTGKPRKTTNGLFVIRYIVGFLITTSIILKLPTNPEINIAKTLLLVYLLLMTVIGSIWLIRNNEEDVPVAWQVFAGSIICAEYLYGFSASGIILAINSIAIMQMILLIFPVNRFTKILGIISAICFSGLPFTPNNIGLSGFTWSGILPGFLFLFPALLAYWSYLRALFRKTSVENLLAERWANFVSPSGLFFSIATPWVISYTWLPNPLQLNLSIQALIMTVAGMTLFFAEISKVLNFQQPVTQIRTYIDQIGDRVAIGIGSINTGTISSTGFLQRPISFLVNLFEGDGGIIWAILCLVLVITLLISLGFS